MRKTEEQEHYDALSTTEKGADEGSHCSSAYVDSAHEGHMNATVAILEPLHGPLTELSKSLYAGPPIKRSSLKWVE